MAARKKSVLIPEPGSIPKFVKNGDPFENCIAVDQIACGAFGSVYGAKTYGGNCRIKSQKSQF